MSAGIYLRVSTEEQRERQTILTQREFMVRWLDLQGVAGVEWYVDDGISGTFPLEERPEGLRLLRDIEAGKIDALYLYRIDRLARSPRVLFNAVHRLEELHCRLVSATESFDTGTPAGRAMLGMLAVFAGFEKDSVVERMTEGLNRIARAGDWPGGQTPYGYVRDGRGLTSDENPLPGCDFTPAGVIRHIYARVASGWTCYRVAEELNALNVPTAKARKGLTAERNGKPIVGLWFNGRVAYLIRQSLYRGLYHYGKRSRHKGREHIFAEVPPLVDAETWEQAIATLIRSRRLPRNPRARNYLLRGLVRCAGCGLTFTGWKGNNYPYYMCGGKHPGKGPVEGCGAKNLPAESAEAWVWGQVEERLRDPERFVERLPEQGRENPYLADLERAENALAEKARERERVLTAFRRGWAKEGDVERQLSDLDQETGALRDQRDQMREHAARLRQQARSQADSAELIARAQELLSQSAAWEHRRAVIEMLIERIVVETRTERGRLVAELRICWKV